MLRAPWAGRSAPQPDLPDLRSLGPAYDENLHGRHAAVLLQVLASTSASAATNIALAGHYGSGKSSVLRGVQAGLDQRKVSWVNLSLSSLGVDDAKRARIQPDGTPAPLTNLIQKEIVKQLLYRKSPADMPGSKYFRIASFRPWPTAICAAAVGLMFFVVAVLLGLVPRVTETAPKTIIKGHDWVPWVIVIVFGVLLSGLCFLIMRTLRSRLRVESVSAGGAAVKLSAKENSYFDEYLDEIVYFFQKTKTRVAIFEDLDRFRDPHIFETLRELNTILNNSEQIRSKPIQFVYAVRDSIFERLDVDTSPGGESDVDVDTPMLRASTLESAPSANRTKFFDLVVPMVPFITHRSSRDLLAAEFADSEQPPSAALMSLVGAYLTDMRLIRNIRNEYEVYRASVLGENGLQGLTADRLFAMMVYKNLHLEDFEAIRHGTSKIDEAYKTFRDLVNYQTDHQATLSKDALDRVTAHAHWDERAKAVGDRLQATLPIVSQAARFGRRPVFQFRSETHELAHLTSGDFWRSLYKTREGVQLIQPGYSSIALSFDELITLAGYAGTELDNAVETDVARLQWASRTALETKELVAKASIAELMARPDLVLPTETGIEQSLDDVVKRLVSPLAQSLLARGYIDENFSLYCSDYHGIAISISAMNFILHCVQPELADHRFRFDKAASIDAVEREMGARFLNSPSVFNIEVFNHYLPDHPQQLDTALGKLAADAGFDTSFLDVYLGDGASPQLLASQLAPRWTGIFVHFIEHTQLDPSVVVALVDAAASNAGRDIDYESTLRVAEFLSDHYAQMPVFIGTAETSKATDLAILAGRLGTQFSNLAELGDTQREAVVSASLYPVTHANLSAALGAGSDLALDRVKTTNEIVYQHVLENLDDYLGSITTQDVTVEAPEEFVAVLQDVAGAAVPALLPVAARASRPCKVSDLNELDKLAWTAVVSAGRFAPTTHNVNQYVKDFGVDNELAKNLGSLSLAEVEEVPEDSRSDLGHALANAESLAPPDQVRLVGQLNLPNGLDPERLTATGLNLLPPLLAAGLVPDATGTYVCVRSRPFEFREEYFASSRGLASYICELPVSSDDLPKIMQSSHVAPAVKHAITADVEFVSKRLSRQGAIAICEWAVMGNIVSVQMLIALSAAGAPTGRILVLLKPHLPTVEQSLLDDLLRTLGAEYEPLTKSGAHRPKVKDRDGAEELLKELKRRGRVSSFSRTVFNEIRVNMRH